jgi:hypothetical protein
LSRTTRLARLLFAALAALACGQKDVGPTGVRPGQPVGRMRFVNAVADRTIADRVNVTVDGAPFGVNLAYGVPAPPPPTIYYPAYQGNRQVTVRRTVDTTVTVLDQPVAITANTDQTVFATRIGTTVSALVVTDNNTPPAGDSIRLRIVHLAPSAGNVDVYVTAPNASLATATSTLMNVSPATASAYLTLASGTYQVRFTRAGSKTVVLSATISALPAGAIRTIVALDPQTGTALTSATLTDR